MPSIRRPFHFGHDPAKPGSDKTIEITINSAELKYSSKVAKAINEALEKGNKVPFKVITRKYPDPYEINFTTEEKQEIKELHARLNNGE